MLRKADLNHRLEMLLSEEKPTLELLRDLGYDQKLLRKKVEFLLLVKLGLIWFFSVQQTAWFFDASTEWVRQHKDKLGFRTVGGLPRTHLRNLMAFASGYEGGSLENKKLTKTVS